MGLSSVKKVAGASEGEIPRLPVGRPLRPMRVEKDGMRWPRAPYWLGGLGSEVVRVVVLDEPEMFASSSSSAADAAADEGENARAKRIWATRNEGRALWVSPQ